MLFGLLVTLAPMGGCGDGDLGQGLPTSQGSTVCVPGTMSACACSAGATGVSTCAADGLAMATCICPDAPAGVDPPTVAPLPPPAGATDPPLASPTPLIPPSAPDEPAAPPPPPPPSEARDVRIAEVALYQAVKVTLARDGAAIEERNAPVIVGKEGFLRVFVEPLQGFAPREIEAELTLRSAENASLVEVVRQRIEGVSQDADLATTINFDIPAGTIASDSYWSVVLREVDPATATGTIDDDVRYPAEADGLARLGARDAGPLRVVIVPYRYQADGSGRLPAIDEAQQEVLREYIYAYYPIIEVEFELHEPVDYFSTIESSRSWEVWLDRHCQLRLDENPDPKVLYYGLVSPTASSDTYRGGTAGISYLPGPAANFGRCSVGLGYEGGEAGFVMAHELGHSLGLPHAPCGVSAGPYPYPDGKIGAWGFGLSSRTLKDPTEFHDMMSYCEPFFISDYNFQKLFERVRYLNLQFAPASSSVAPTRYARVLQTSDGEVTLVGHHRLDHPPAGDEERRKVHGVGLDGQALSQPLDAYFIPTAEGASGVWFVPSTGVSRALLGGAEVSL